MGRIGKLHTKRGTVETPLLLPVVNPLLQPIPPKELVTDFGCRAIIANAYLLRKNFGKEVVTKGIHAFLEFEHTVVTDSGAYQILLYGDIEATQREIIAYEEAIDTDIAVILDVPTGGKASRKKAEYTVEETIRRARESIASRTRDDILWIGPVQGGNHLDLVSYSASEMAKLPFAIYALGSPTQVMEQYVFDYLVDMTMTAKMNLPPDKPLHLFGAGHAFMFALVVAMGCDIFDSAAYAIYARDRKYMTNRGTERLESLEYFPCSCRVCTDLTPKELCSLPTKETTRLLAQHNIGVCLAEIRNIKQAIREGRLWELVELRARSHPSLLQALKTLGKYQDYIERNSPVTHNRGLFYFGSTGLARPEVVRHRAKIRAWQPPEAEILVLLPEMSSKPFHRSREMKRVRTIFRKQDLRLDALCFCVYAPPFGVVPLELDETYPLSQYEAAMPTDEETGDYVVQEVVEYIERKRQDYRTIVFYANGALGEQMARKMERVASRPSPVIVKMGEHIWARKALTTLAETIAKASE